ncbi:MAG: biotin/lipoate A/B protein ligase family protein [Hyphomicrobiales bacterium]
MNRNSQDPYFNIAAEEYFLKQFDDDIFMLWINSPSIIIGKHQNAYKEIDREIIKERKIPIIRRITGGGTVYHDSGNLNFTFIKSSKRKDNLVSFEKYTLPIIEALQKLGADAHFAGNNNICIGSKKISGNAAHVYRNRVMHHGTILFNSDLTILNNIINNKKNFFEDKAVKSNTVPVTNVKDHINANIGTQEFLFMIEDIVTKTFDDIKYYSLTIKDINNIEKLIRERYSTWDWNFGYSPTYKFTNNIDIDAASYSIELKIRNGRIKDLEILKDKLPYDKNEIIYGSLHDEKHHPEIIHSAMERIIKEHPSIPVEIEKLFF